MESDSDKARAQERLASIDKQLGRYYKRLNRTEEAIPISSVDEQVKLQILIDEELYPSILDLEANYAAVLDALQGRVPVPEAVAGPLVENIQHALASTTASDLPLPTDVADNLRMLRDHLERPETSAAAKLKVAIPIIPLLVRYELELDTEVFFTNIWTTIKSKMGKNSAYLLSNPSRTKTLKKN